MLRKQKLFFRLMLLLGIFPPCHRGSSERAEEGTVKLEGHDSDARPVGVMGVTFSGDNRFFFDVR